MARPTKEGLDYFSIDCVLNDRVKFIIAEFKVVGWGILTLLWKKIYGEKGYYTHWDDDVALLFASECGVGVNVVGEVVSACLRRGIFDRGLYDQYRILTSEGIQERFAEATSRRSSQKIDGRYLLIAAPKNWVSVDNNSVSVDNNSINVDNNTQSKVKESKVKEIHSFIHTRESDVECWDQDDDDGEELLTEGYRRKRYGKSQRVLLSDEQMEYLLKKLSLEEFDHYLKVVDDNESKGHRYRKKTHFQAILDMAKADRRTAKKREGQHES